MKTISSFLCGAGRPQQLWRLSALAVLWMVPAVLGEDNVPAVKEEATVVGRPGENPLYTVKFEGGRMGHFAELWKKAIPSDSLVITESAERPRLPAFEIRNARLNEVARSIAFLSEGALTIEVVEGSSTTPGNIWRIGTGGGKAAAAVKMRAVAAPNLFASEERVNGLLKEGELLEDARLATIEQLGKAEGITMQTRIRPLTTQKVFVLIGNEDGIAGMESYIKACEQNAAIVVGRENAERAEIERAKGLKNGN